MEIGQIYCNVKHDWSSSGAVSRENCGLKTMVCSYFENGPVSSSPKSLDKKGGPAPFPDEV